MGTRRSPKNGTLPPSQTPPCALPAVWPADVGRRVRGCGSPGRVPVSPQGPAATRGCCSPAQRSPRNPAGRGQHPSRCSAPHPPRPPRPYRGLAPKCQTGDVSQLSPTVGLKKARWKKLSRCQLYPRVPESSRDAALSSPLLNGHACRDGSSHSLYKSQESQFLKRNKGICVSKSHLLQGMGDFGRAEKEE